MIDNYANPETVYSIPTADFVEAFVTLNECVEDFIVYDFSLLRAVYFLLN